MNNNLPFWPEWTVEKQIGKGSYGSVYRIRKRGTGSNNTEILSAMKVLRVPADPSEILNLKNQGMGEASIRKLLQNDVKAIENEIQVMLSLATAAGVVAIEDYHIEPLPNEIGWVVFIRMELLESLPDYLARVGTLTKEEVLKMGCDICDALTACESVKIIHRDIKPANIFRNRFGQFKLGDFGIAKQMEGTHHAATRIGTPSYEAPEVFNRQEYDHTVDIYGLGMVLYTCLNQGRKPFYPPYPEELTRENMQEALQRRLNGEPVPPVRGMDKKLHAIIGKACAFRPSDRYRSAAEFKEELEEYRNNLKKAGGDALKARKEAGKSQESFGDEATEPVSPKKKPKGILIAVVILAVAALAAGGLLIAGQLRGNGGGEEGPAKISTAATAPGETPTAPGETPALPTEIPIPVVIVDTPSAVPAESAHKYSSISTGDIITFGSYEQDNDTSNGKEEIKWLVLATEDDRALLISKYALDCQRYNNNYSSVTWETCTLRTWLNDTFINTAFTEEERAGIPAVTVKNSANSEYGTEGGKDTRDQIFLLSIEEVNQYFGTNEERVCIPTKYAKAQGTLSNSEGNCWWWLRSPGYGSHYAANVYIGGSVLNRGNSVNSVEGAVRPALWIEQESDLFNF